MSHFVVLTSISTYPRISASRIARDLARLPNERSRRDMSISDTHGVLVFELAELCLGECSLTRCRLAMLDFHHLRKS